MPKSVPAKRKVTVRKAVVKRSAKVSAKKTASVRKARKPVQPIVEITKQRDLAERVPAAETGNLVNILDELAWLIENGSEIDRSNILHGIDPKLASSNTFLPKGTTYADLWITRHGDPLISMNAALEVLKLVAENANWQLHFENGLFQMMVLQPHRVHASARTAASAITAAALYLQIKKDTKK